MGEVAYLCLSGKNRAGEKTTCVRTARHLSMIELLSLRFSADTPATFLARRPARGALFASGAARRAHGRCSGNFSLPPPGACLWLLGNMSGHLPSPFVPAREPWLADAHLLLKYGALYVPHGE